jgi:hypothetical protein
MPLLVAASTQPVKEVPMANRAAVREYVNGSLWVWPGVSAAAALLVGWMVAGIDVGPGSPLSGLAF